MWDWMGYGFRAELYAIVGHVLTGVFILLILSSREETQSPFGWLLAVVFVPWVAGPAYLIFGGYRVRRVAGRRVQRDRQFMRTLPPQLGGMSEEAAESTLGSDSRRSVLQDYPNSTGNEVEVFGHGEEKYARLEADIRAARDHIHLAYYLWANDSTGMWLRDLLTEKVEEGVEVRVLYDAWGAPTAGWLLRPLRRAGGWVRAFAPLLSPSTILGANLRNHRKIVVLDGKVAYTGGINIGDDYRGREGPRLWKDLHLRADGPVTRQIASIFAKDWHYVTGSALVAPRFYPRMQADGPSVARVLPSGPGQYWRAFHETIFNAITSAQDWIQVVTPYYVPDQSMQMALGSAARRGVRVRMLVPRHNNHPMVAAASNSFYEELLEAGVEIYRSQQGMVHGKQVTVDGRWATVGSANLDARSFYLNYELNVILKDQGPINHLSMLFEDELHTAGRVTLEDYRHRPAWKSSLEGLARTLSPML
ncbi:cardiolipin synthase [Thiohalorhabdus methylotrophus]|uniref:Cardiolipin synthase n=1 Tax=Thiohalorhabdus methylotrophus TaxID=3242694 RepID=A0ABV4TYB7_9GAMM